ncbi:MAG: hypothetical protein CSA81_14580 [Acidobacteria bacterium]|nr:MAG: hypothetical protein CSA81_14580 [Acidobacteriota bacterium]
MFLLFDIGGTKTRVAAVEKDATVINEDQFLIFPTPELFDDGVEQIVNAAWELTGKKKLEAGCGGVGNPLNQAKSALINSSGKKVFIDWDQKPLRATLEKSLDCEIFLENDALLGGLGEAVFGAGKGTSLVGYLTVGTGVGGAKIENGKIAPNNFGFELGRQIIQIKKGSPIALRELISGRDIEKRFNQIPSEIKDPAFWQESAHYLAIGIYNAAIFWSVEKIVLGGTITKYIPLEKTQAEFSKLFTGLPFQPTIEKASLGELSGLYGALRNLKDKINS